MPGFYLSPGDMSSGPHTWAAGRLLTRDISPFVNSLNSCASSVEQGVLQCTGQTDYFKGGAAFLMALVVVVMKAF